MEQAKAAVAKFTGRHGHHTDVEEVVNPGVTSETVKPTRHENITQAIDREVHQHHHHTTVQPLQHQEVLPEKHSHNMIPVEHREFNHDNENETKERLALEAAKFKDTTTTHETKHTQASMPIATGEHVHHHVHETVQPVIHKETIQPEVVHTTVPVHETHHGQAQHHGASMLPMKTLSEFTGSGGSLTGGKSITHEEYEGQPRPYNKDLQMEFQDMGNKHHQNGITGHRPTDSGVSGLGSEGASGTRASELGQDRTSGGMGTTTTTTTGTTTKVAHSGNQGDTSYGNTGANNTTGYNDNLDQTASGRTQKPSLMDRLNPKVDSTGDGKAGFMK